METTISEEIKRKILIMKELSFFKSFTAGELLVLLEECAWVKCNNGEIICNEGDYDNYFYVILKGSVTVRKKGSGFHNLAILGTGECFGEMSVITGEQRSADIIANEESYLVKIGTDALNKESDSLTLKSLQMKFYKIFSQILASRLQKATNKLVNAPISKWK